MRGRVLQVPLPLMLVVKTVVLALAALVQWLCEVAGGEMMMHSAVCCLPMSREVVERAVAVWPMVRLEQQGV